MIQRMVGSIIGGLITAYVLALVIKATGSTALVDGLLVSLWIWLGFVATSSVLAFVCQKRPIRLWMLESGNHLLSLVVMGMVLGAWQQAFDPAAASPIFTLAIATDMTPWVSQRILSLASAAAWDRRGVRGGLCRWVAKPGTVACAAWLESMIPVLSDASATGDEPS